MVLLMLRGTQRPAPTTYRAFGRGPAVVLVHGLGSSDAHWLPTARILARRFRVTLVDLPGHGPSDMPQDFSLEQVTVALDRALAEIGDEPVILVGHSLGGLVAASEALAHPERVRGLVLVETALSPQVPPDARNELLAQLDAQYDALIHAAYLDFGRDSLQGERLYWEVAQLDPDVVKPWIRLAWTADLSTQIRKLIPPMLAVLAPRSWPEGEPWERTARELGYEGVPDVEAVRIDGCGHFVMLDRPDELARLIERFAATPEAEPVASIRGR